MGRLSLLIGGIILGFVFLTVVMHRFFRQRPVIKYIVPVLSLTFCLYNIKAAQTTREGFEDIGRIIIALMFGSAAAAGFLSAIFLDLILPRMQKKF